MQATPLRNADGTALQQSPSGTNMGCKRLKRCRQHMAGWLVLLWYAQHRSATLFLPQTDLSLPMHVLVATLLNAQHNHETHVSIFTLLRPSHLMLTHATSTWSVGYRQASTSLWSLYASTFHLSFRYSAFQIARTRVLAREEAGGTMAKDWTRTVASAMAQIYQINEGGLQSVPVR